MTAVSRVVSESYTGWKGGDKSEGAAFGESDPAQLISWKQTHNTQRQSSGHTFAVVDVDAFTIDFGQRRQPQPIDAVADLQRQPPHDWVEPERRSYPGQSDQEVSFGGRHWTLDRQPAEDGRGSAEKQLQQQ